MTAFGYHSQGVKGMASGQPMGRPGMPRDMAGVGASPVVDTSRRALASNSIFSVVPREPCLSPCHWRAYTARRWCMGFAHQGRPVIATVQRYTALRGRWDSFMGRVCRHLFSPNPWNIILKFGLTSNDILMHVRVDWILRLSYYSLYITHVTALLSVIVSQYLTST